LWLQLHPSQVFEVHESYVKAFLLDLLKSYLPVVRNNNIVAPSFEYLSHGKGVCLSCRLDFPVSNSAPIYAKQRTRLQHGEKGNFLAGCWE
jgi:hypothetical protein